MLLETQWALLMDVDKIVIIVMTIIVIKFIINFVIIIIAIQRELFCVLMEMDQTATFMQVFLCHNYQCHHLHSHMHLLFFIHIIFITLIIWHEGGHPRDLWFWLHLLLREMPLGHLCHPCQCHHPNFLTCHQCHHPQLIFIDGNIFKITQEDAPEIFGTGCIGRYQKCLWDLIEHGESSTVLFFCYFICIPVLKKKKSICICNYIFVYKYFWVSILLLFRLRMWFHGSQWCLWSSPPLGCASTPSLLSKSWMTMEVFRCISIYLFVKCLCYLLVFVLIVMDNNLQLTVTLTLSVPSSWLICSWLSSSSWFERTTHCWRWQRQST